MKHQYFPIFITIILPFASGFGTSFNALSINSRVSQDTPSLRNVKRSTLFVASARDVNETDSPVIRSLDAQMKKMQKEKEKMVEQVSKASLTEIKSVQPNANPNE